MEIVVAGKDLEFLEEFAQRFSEGDTRAALSILIEVGRRTIATGNVDEVRKVALLHRVRKIVSSCGGK